MGATGLDAVRRLAARQHGVVTVAQARRLGVTESQLRTERSAGRWVSPWRGVLLSTTAPATWHRDAALATSSLGAVLSHRGAARLHGLDGFARAAVEVTVARSRRLRDRPFTVHQATALEPLDITQVDGVPVTSIARTLVDLGAVVRDDLVEQALDDALRRGVSSKWVIATLERLERPGPSGSGALRRVLARPDRAGPLPDSTFERLIERATTAAGLPPPVRQIPVHDEQGRVFARLDAGWPEAGLAVEAHSERWHWGPRRGRSDLQRDNRLAAAGWELLYATWSDVRDPTELIGSLVAAYHRRRLASGTPDLLRTEQQRRQGTVAPRVE